MGRRISGILLSPAGIIPPYPEDHAHHWKEIGMSAAPKPYISPEQYLERERQAEAKSEYFAGEIFAMAGASEEHNIITVNLARELSSQLLERPCQVYGGDMKVRATEELYVYPDITVVCGERQFDDDEKDV